MSLTLRRRPLFLLTLMFVIAVGGCAAPRKWKATVCYEGPPRPFSDISVVLLRAKALHYSQIRRIDEASVPDSVEYHLSPGTHAIAVGVSRGESKEMAITCDLRPGYVYSLTFDVWNLSSKAEPLLYFQKVEFDWRPRLVELGRYDELTSGQYVNEVVMEHIRPRPLTFMILTRQSFPAVGSRGEYAHYVGVGNIASILVVFPVEMPAEHWGVWPKGWRTAREGDRLGEPWPPRSDRL